GILFLYSLEFYVLLENSHYTPLLGHAVSKTMPSHTGMNCPRLIELVGCANGLQPLNDELICTAECCKNLTAMGLGDCEVTCRDFIKFVKMHEARLTLLSITEEVLIPDNYYNLDQIHSEISKHRGRMWFPVMRLLGKLATENINMVKIGSRCCFLCK
uniref:Uncharacterized protein n=1 Tax=Chelonoidis abingdonii TaxID=106734 RepID=A0A8C0QSH5_CHEAB